MSPADLELVRDAFESNWIAPLGPHVDQFEEEFASAVEVPYALALSSGTAALHLALIVAGVTSGDEVIVSDLTFAASANAVAYVGAKPVFIDADPDTLRQIPFERFTRLDTVTIEGNIDQSMALSNRLPRVTIEWVVPEETLADAP